MRSAHVRLMALILQKIMPCLINNNCPTYSRPPVLNHGLMMVTMKWEAVFVMTMIMSCINGESSSSSSISVSIHGAAAIGKVDPKFICATLDWWPPTKCDYGTCSWGLSSILNLDLSNRRLQNAVKGLSPFLRLGGSLQDKVVYQVGNIQTPCLPFTQTSELFGYSDGCLNMSRWDALNQFFQATGAPVAVGLNALYNRETNTAKAWDSSNSRDFIQYTASKGYKIEAWELGNELTGSGVGTSIGLSQYAADVQTLRAIIDEVYADWGSKPLLVAPDGFYDENWFQQLLQSTGPSIVNAVTQHIYNLGPGDGSNLVKEILDPSYLGQEEWAFQSIKQMLQTSAPWAQAWVGEAGGAYNSGHHLVTDAFVFSFWYLDQLGMAAKHDTKVYCRQSMVGGNYGLLDYATFEPNPDYFSALLWKQLMGADVLSATVDGSPYIRAYAHCTQGDAQSITVLILNLNSQTQYTVDLTVSYSKQESVHLTKATTGYHTINSTKHAVNIRKAAITGRLEYHLTAANGNLNSQSVLLNGNKLAFTADGNVPDLKGTTRDASEPLVIAPASIVFVTLPGVSIAACNQVSGA